jgi:hypothetical protein
MIHSIKLTAFRAIDYPQMAESICNKHTRRLSEFNIIALCNLENSWLTNPSVYCICAIDEERYKILGAIRIQLSDSINRLPMEIALNQFDINIRGKINNLNRDGTVAESCGLWCSEEPVAKKINLSSKILSFETMVCRYLNIQHCIAFVPNHSLNICLKASFKKDMQFADPFPYPDEKYQSWILYKTPLALKESNDDMKIRILINDSHLVYRSELENDIIIIKYELLNFGFGIISDLSKTLSHAL